MPCGSDSISVNTVEPVVVKPDMVSKKAFVKPGMAPLITVWQTSKKRKNYPNQCNNDISFMPANIGFYFRVKKSRSLPATTLIPEDIRKAC
jgi:hypothetical protein